MGARSPYPDRRYRRIRRDIIQIYSKIDNVEIPFFLPTPSRDAPRYGSVANFAQYARKYGSPTIAMRPNASWLSVYICRAWRRRANIAGSLELSARGFRDAPRFGALRKRHVRLRARIAPDAPILRRHFTIA